MGKGRGERAGAIIGRFLDKSIFQPVSQIIEGIGESVDEWKAESALSSDAMQINNAVECTKHKITREEGYNALAKYGIGRQGAAKLAEMDPTHREYWAKTYLIQRQSGEQH